MIFQNFIVLLCSVIVAVINADGDAEGSKGDSPPYDVIFDYFEVYNNTEKLFTDVKMRVRKHNRTTYVLNGQFTTECDFSDALSAEFRASSESGNEFKIIHTAKTDKLCSALIDNEIVYPELCDFGNLPKVDPDMCPIPKNTYVIKDYYMMDSRLPQKLPSGDKWKIDIIVYDSGEVTIAISIYIILEKKRPKVPKGP